VEKYGRTKQATDDNTMRFAWWITKATHTHTLRICKAYSASLLLTENSLGIIRLNLNQYRWCVLSCTVKTEEISFASVDIEIWSTDSNAQRRDSVVSMLTRLRAGRYGI
jgi:hypothetical protein